MTIKTHTFPQPDTHCVLRSHVEYVSLSQSSYHLSQTTAQVSSTWSSSMQMKQNDRSLGLLSHLRIPATNEYFLPRPPSIFRALRSLWWFWPFLLFLLINILTNTTNSNLAPAARKRKSCIEKMKNPSEKGKTRTLDNPVVVICAVRVGYPSKQERKLQNEPESFQSFCDFPCGAVGSIPFYKDLSTLAVMVSGITAKKNRNHLTQQAFFPRCDSNNKPPAVSGALLTQRFINEPLAAVVWRQNQGCWDSARYSVGCGCYGNARVCQEVGCVRCGRIGGWMESLYIHNVLPCYCLRAIHTMGLNLLIFIFIDFWRLESTVL